MRTRRALFLLAAVVGVGASCSDGDDAPAASADGGPDDAVSDARAQGDADASAPGDAGTDANEDPLSIGSWTPIPGIPSYCGDIARADDPSLWKSTWIPCSSGRTGCRKLDTSWSMNNALPVDLFTVDAYMFSLEPARLVNGTGYILWRRYWNTPDKEILAWVDVLEPLEGAPVMAIGQRARWHPSGRRWLCVGNTVFGDYGVGFMASPYEPTDTTPDGGQTYVTGWAPWSAPSPFTMRSLHVVSDFDLAGGSWLSAKTLGANGLWSNTRDPDGILHYDLNKGAVVKPPQGARTLSPLPIPGGAIVFDENAAQGALAIVKEDGSLERLVTPSGSQWLTHKTLDRSTNPPTLVWVESNPFAATPATLSTAPLVATEADLVRRTVAKLNDSQGTGGGWGVANRGVYLSRVGLRKALLTRLSDGMGWLIDAEPDEAFLQPVWVDDEDIVIVTTKYYPQIDAVGHASGMLRIARSSLGAPTVPSGL